MILIYYFSPFLVKKEIKLRKEIPSCVKNKEK